MIVLMRVFGSAHMAPFHPCKQQDGLNVVILKHVVVLTSHARGVNVGLVSQNKASRILATCATNPVDVIGFPQSSKRSL